jgi:hypothetical protein
MSDPIPDEVVQEIGNLLRAGQKIDAIKLYREHSGKGLKESKEFVEAIEADLRAKNPGSFTAPAGGKGCLTAFVLCGLAAGVIVIVATALLSHH